MYKEGSILQRTRIEERLIDEWRAIMPLPIHIQIVGALERNCSKGANLAVPYCNGQADLTGHRSTADDRLVQSELLNCSTNETDIAIFSIGMLA